jgi:hypothetical protein
MNKTTLAAAGLLVIAIIIVSYYGSTYLMSVPSVNSTPTPTSSPTETSTPTTNPTSTPIPHLSQLLIPLLQTPLDGKSDNLSNSSTFTNSNAAS